MSCNCNNNPCSCANANCACPPDYTVTPASLTCQGTPCDDTLSTDCIFTSEYLSCSAVPIGATIQVALQAMDEKICQCGSCSGTTFQVTPLFYVDSRSDYTGDGSITTPFQTLDEAYDKVLGSGTTTLPEFSNAVIWVLGGSYTTSQNIYLAGITWNFEVGTSVTFTGSTTYFIDSTSASAGADEFKVTGHLYFTTSTGGFIKNSGSYGTGFNKRIYVEANTIFGKTTQSTGTPLINQNQTYTGSDTPLETIVKMQKPQSFILSATQTTISSTGGILYIDLGGADLLYGIDPTGGGNTGVSGSYNLYYNSADNNTDNTRSTLILKNGNIGGQGNTNMIYMTGVFNRFIIDNIKTKNLGGTAPSLFLNIGSVSQPSVADNFQFLLKEVYIDPFSVLGSTNFAIDYTGTVPQTLPYLEMQNCVIYAPLTVNYSTISLNSFLYEGLSAASINVIKGLLHVTNIPSYVNQSAAVADGLKSGDVWTGTTSPNALYFIP